MRGQRSLLLSATTVVAASVVLLLLTRTADSFAPPNTLSTSKLARTSTIAARLSSSLKAKQQSKKAKGFGKQQQQVETTTPSSAKDKPDGVAKEDDTASERTQSDKKESKPFLQSVVDEAADPEERAKTLLREKYGMKTLAEQQLDVQQLEARKEQQKKLAQWKAKAERGEDFDIMSVLPAPVLIAIDRFLKFGTAVCTVAFVSAGVLITAEAGSKALDSPLPENLDNFIVNTVEPNFTPGLLVLLAFSISLGIFAALQLGSQGSTYKED